MIPVASMVPKPLGGEITKRKPARTFLSGKLVFVVAGLLLVLAVGTVVLVMAAKRAEAEAKEAAQAKEAAEAEALDPEEAARIEAEAQRAIEEDRRRSEDAARERRRRAGCDLDVPDPERMCRKTGPFGRDEVCEVRCPVGWRKIDVGGGGNSFAPLGVPSNSFASLGVPSNSFAPLGVPSNSFASLGVPSAAKEPREQCCGFDPSTLAEYDRQMRGSLAKVMAINMAYSMVLDQVIAKLLSKAVPKLVRAGVRLTVKVLNKVAVLAARVAAKAVAMAVKLATKMVVQGALAVAKMSMGPPGWILTAIQGVLMVLDLVDPFNFGAFTANRTYIGTRNNMVASLEKTMRADGAEPPYLFPITMVYPKEYDAASADVMNRQQARVMAQLPEDEMVAFWTDLLGAEPEDEAGRAALARVQAKMGDVLGTMDPVERDIEIHRRLCMLVGPENVHVEPSLSTPKRVAVTISAKRAAEFNEANARLHADVNFPGFVPYAASSRFWYEVDGTRTTRVVLGVNAMERGVGSMLGGGLEDALNPKETVPALRRYAFPSGAAVPQMTLLGNLKYATCMGPRECQKLIPGTCAAFDPDVYAKAATWMAEGLGAGGAVDFASDLIASTGAVDTNKGIGGNIARFSNINIDQNINYADYGVGFDDEKLICRFTCRICERFGMQFIDFDDPTISNDPNAKINDCGLYPGQDVLEFILGTTASRVVAQYFQTMSRGILLAANLGARAYNAMCAHMKPGEGGFCPVGCGLNPADLLALCGYDACSKKCRTGETVAKTVCTAVDAACTVTCKGAVQAAMQSKFAACMASAQLGIRASGSGTRRQRARALEEALAAGPPEGVTRAAWEETIARLRREWEEAGGEEGDDAEDAIPEQPPYPPPAPEGVTEQEWLMMLAEAEMEVALGVTTEEIEARVGARRGGVASDGGSPSAGGAKDSTRAGGSGGKGGGKGGKIGNLSMLGGGVALDARSRAALEEAEALLARLPEISPQAPPGVPARVWKVIWMEAQRRRAWAEVKEEARTGVRAGAVSASGPLRWSTEIPPDPSRFARFAFPSPAEMPLAPRAGFWNAAKRAAQRAWEAARRAAEAAAAAARALAERTRRLEQACRERRDKDVKAGYGACEKWGGQCGGACRATVEFVVDAACVTACMGGCAVANMPGVCHARDAICRGMNALCKWTGDIPLPNLECGMGHSGTR